MRRSTSTRTIPWRPRSSTTGAPEIRPWFDDHRVVDPDKARRSAGHDVDLDRPRPLTWSRRPRRRTPSLFAMVGPYLDMATKPDGPDAARPRAREIYAGGWRAPVPDGPTRGDLVDLITSAVPA